MTEERLRIARDLHDVVAHSMSLIAVQAGVGAHVIRTDPAAAEQSLGVIADTSRKALEQTRSMLGMLREESEDGTRPPTQGLDDLPALADDVRAAGLEVTLLNEGAVADLDAAVSLAAYRIVQESLTNVIKHSVAATATVSVTVNERQLEIEVSDPGPRRGAPSAMVSRPRVGRARRARPPRRRDARRTAPRAAGSASTRPCPTGPADDPRRGRRRPGPGAGRVRDAARARRRTSRSWGRRATGSRR